MQYQNIGIVSFKLVPLVTQVVERISSILNQLKVSFHCNPELAQLINNPNKSLSIEQLIEQCDLIIVIGGDGSILKTAVAVCNTDLPMIGINLGRLGFLTQIQPDAIETELIAVLQGNYICKKVDVISGRVDTLEKLPALNDIVVHSNARVIELRTYIDNNFLSHIRSDGIIVATTIGSTAYALSCGGAILTPDLPCLQIVPINPHTLSSRSLVLPVTAKIEIELVNSNQSKVQVVADGQRSLPMQTKQKCQISLSGTVNILQNKAFDFFYNLRNKMQLYSLSEKIQN